MTAPTSTVAPSLGPAYVQAIPPYFAGKPIAEVAREFSLDVASIIKLASNENPLGMPSSARLAVTQALNDVGRYPDANGFALKSALSRQYGIPEDWLTLGNGSNDILELVAHACVQPGQSVVYAEHSFVAYPRATQAVGATAIVVPAVDFGHDLDGMLAAVDETTRLIFIANPNNPTGTFLPGAALLSFVEKIPPHVVVVLDEAYTEYLRPDQSYDAIKWVERFPNLLISRTFSKAYGLAGLRVGFGIAQPPLTDLLNRIRQPFNVNHLAQAAAVAALADTPFLAQSYAVNVAGHEQLAQGFSALGLRYIPSSGNFVLVKVGDDVQAGGRIYLALLKQGVIVRPVDNYGLPQWLRISIGLPDENERCLRALKLALT